ncbi:hypothetical protein BO79DRAFT_229594 [Aspergillus costaricaensis CBS 115574]|uniref:Uncharacterized protein n=1 Tax=Aspergillus costaricaensis CBS 115574 TaxID=1448317 RepID=A0ACD1IBF2_9EURO|nr:hypothetical protein BO79DRAFT_229594 [Aspergillus costaricaensis CBS 115574]RAK87685.1 hypothetical protein BO79DRAFT_229594 [Aspergillus costaricaensis CBS 115574]
MHVGRSATVTGHRIICNMHFSAVSPADTSYIEQMAVLLHQRVLPVRLGILLGFFGRDLSQPCLGRGGAPIRRVRIGSAIVRSDMIRRQKGQWPWWACGNRLRNVPIRVQLRSTVYSGHWLGHPNSKLIIATKYRNVARLPFDLGSTKSLPDICHVGSRNDGQQWRCVPRNCFPTPVLRGAVACPVHRFEIFGGPRRTNRPPATPGLRYSTIRY